MSARLYTVEEIDNLVKLLRAGTVFIEKTADGDMDVPLNLTKRVEAMDVPLNLTKRVEASTAPPK